MLLLAMFIIGHAEIGGGYCRTDLKMYDDIVTMEYPCEYYSELRNLDSNLKELLGE